MQLIGCAQHEVIVGRIVNFQQVETLHALQDDRGGLVGHFKHAHDFGHRAYGIEIFQFRAFYFSSYLAYCANDFAVFRRLVDEAE